MLRKSFVCSISALIVFAAFSGKAMAQGVSDVAGVKSYLVSTVEKMKLASADFVKNAEAYQVALGKGQDVKPLIAKMQENYKAMDSFGYETVEGIVAGIDSLNPYDIYLDAGVPKSEGPDDVAPVSLKLSGGGVIDQEGSLFTHIIEPALWGGNDKWMLKSKSGQVPRPEVLQAAAKDVDQKIAELLRDAKELNPSSNDLVGAMIVMTPTLSDYFEDWKESRYSADKSGKFQAVSRVSDMRGIMSSCAVMYDAIHADLAKKDAPLAASVQKSFKDILSFLDTIEAREGKGGIKPAEIDELAEQAKSRTDKLVPQMEQAQAQLAKNG
jgi:hypothetical protein